MELHCKVRLPFRDGMGTRGGAPRRALRAGVKEVLQPCELAITSRRQPDAHGESDSNDRFK